VCSPRPAVTAAAAAAAVPCLQVRAFDNDEVVHVDDSVDPIRDLDTIQVRSQQHGGGGGQGQAHR
jgi:hypothetical protein